MRSEFATLSRMVPVDVVLPLTSTLSAVLPEGSLPRGYDPFGVRVTIEEIRDDVIVMTSMQRPKKVPPLNRHDDFQIMCNVDHVRVPRNMRFSR